MKSEKEGEKEGRKHPSDLLHVLHGEPLQPVIRMNRVQ